MGNKKIILISLCIFFLSPLFAAQQKDLTIPYKTMSGINNVGDTATNFTLADIYGNEHTLYDFKGKIILLHVGSTG
jgi:cytochrome oxidase Cu insertion factor (SCO1/SenC/PrrC family)